MRRPLAITLAVILVSLPLESTGDPVRLKSGAKCTTQAGNVVDLSPGTVALHAEDWTTLDAEFKRLQDAETRLAAENASLKKTDAPGLARIVAVTSALLSGIALGYYIGNK